MDGGDELIGVTFGDKHSYDDFGLILSSKEIGFPDPHTETVSVIGRNGDIDLTEALGAGVTFGNRKLTFTFSVISPGNWSDTVALVGNYLHGQKMKVVMDADPDYYYYGRCKINSYKTSKALGTLTIECDAMPYKTAVDGSGKESI